jgi:cytochrome bd-type quinol oxidase subunit 1
MGKRVSIWWMFVPIFFGFAGGFFAWKANKEREEEMARVMLAIGLAFSLVIIPFYLWFFFTYL